MGPESLQSMPISSIGASAGPARRALRITSVPGCCAASAPQPAIAHAITSAMSARAKSLRDLFDDRIKESVHASRAGQVLASVASTLSERRRRVDALDIGAAGAQRREHGLV